jgi:hypothetical protein
VGGGGGGGALTEPDLEPQFSITLPHPLEVLAKGPPE